MHPSTYPSSNTSAINPGQHNMTQTLSMLHDEDPQFSSMMQTLNFERGQVVATPDDLAQKMFVLMNGKINMVCTNNEGRRLVIATLEPGAVFGEGALDNPGDPNVFAEAAETISVWQVPAGEARNLTIQYPILGWGLLQTYGARLLQV
ncbi:MAG: Crp/Fnr family transcriptional regulator, partial [Caldilineaceae bacterium]|nr:Crp/Fnr family transcriptional regulator [Caldilineaceae bacterium]